MYKKKTNAVKEALRLYSHLLQDNTKIIGLGSGSTTEILIDLIDTKTTKATFTSTSLQSETLAKNRGLTLTNHFTSIDITFDGADEITIENGNRLKGGGGNLLREKIICEASKLNIILVHEEKVSKALGTLFSLPIEITPFGSKQTTNKIQKELNCFSPTLNLRKKNNNTYITDNQNYIIDITLSEPIYHPAKLLYQLKIITGVVEVGIFCGQKNESVIIGREDRADVLYFGD